MLFSRCLSPFLLVLSPEGPAAGSRGPRAISFTRASLEPGAAPGTRQGVNPALSNEQRRKFTGWMDGGTVFGARTGDEVAPEDGLARGEAGKGDCLPESVKNHGEFGRGTEMQRLHGSHAGSAWGG